MFGNTEVEDLKAAKKGFMDIFDAEIKEQKEESKNKFVSSYRRMFKHLKKDYVHYNSGTNQTECIRKLNYVINSINSLHNKSMIEQADILGKSMAVLFFTIEYHIASTFGKDGNGTTPWDIIKLEEKRTFSERRVSPRIALIAKELKDLGKNISLRFINNRLKDIAKKKGNEMEQDQIEFIINMASRFE